MKPKWNEALVDQYEKDTKDIVKIMSSFKKRWQGIAKESTPPDKGKLADRLHDIEADFSDFLQNFMEGVDSPTE